MPTTIVVNDNNNNNVPVARAVAVDAPVPGFADVVAMAAATTEAQLERARRERAETDRLNALREQEIKHRNEEHEHQRERDEAAWLAKATPEAREALFRNREDAARRAADVARAEGEAFATKVVVVAKAVAGAAIGAWAATSI